MLPGLESLLPRLKTFTAAEILAMDFPPIPWIVPDYLPPGLTFLYGKPKVGKSWMALQLALSVSTGGKVFSKDIQARRVLYLALEDRERRLKDRMKKQNWPADPSVDYMFYDEFREMIGALNSGGGKRLLAYIDAQKFGLVIVDTFSRSIQGDQLDSTQMVEAVGPLQQYALSRDIGLIFVDHMPKNTVIIDPIANLYGSVAKAGIMDTAWGIYKEQGKRGATLTITGRDVEEHTLKLVFEMDGYYWHCEGEAPEIEMTDRRQEILEYLKDQDQPTRLSRIAKDLGKDRGNTFKRLADLCNSGLIKRLGDLYEAID
jgi:RecA-family ATPase